MIIGSLRIDDVEIGKIKMPETHDEIRYGQYLDFAMITLDTNVWLGKQMEAKRDYQNQYRVKLAYAAATVYDVDHKLLLKLKYDGLDVLESAYTAINNLISSFTPHDNGGSFIHNGVTYTIPTIVDSIFKGTNNLPSFSFQQLTEIAESERILTDNIKKIDAQQKDENEFKGTVVSKAMQKSQHTFQNTIKKIVLCLTPPNEIPVDDTFDLWLERKMIELKDISMPNALNTLFFLRSIPSDYEASIAYGFISNVLKSHGIETNHLSSIQNELPILSLDQNESEI